ncbi:MAG: hypothetical protein P1U67_12805 [Alcanivoracaceae bacterium]|nr:hypothetical protein [Alcanivoracaceae bacterium]
MNARLNVLSACLPQPLAQCAASLGDSVLRLQDEPAAILKGLHRCGPVQLTSGNRSCRIVVNADYRNLCLGVGGVGYLTKPSGMLNLQLSQWQTVLAAVAPVGDIPARSLMFFDRQGELLHQVTVSSPGFAFEELVCAMLHPEQHSLPLPEPLGCSDAVDVDVCALERDWSSACDDECFERMLLDHGVSRFFAMRFVRDSYALAVQPESAVSLLGMIAEQGAPVSLSVSNKGCEQRVVGVPHLFAWQGKNISIQVNGATLILRPEDIACCWRVRRRGASGIRTGVELFDTRGALVLTITNGDYKLGQDDDPWRSLIGNALMPLRKTQTIEMPPTKLDPPEILH